MEVACEQALCLGKGWENREQDIKPLHNDSVWLFIPTIVIRFQIISAHKKYN